MHPRFHATEEVAMNADRRQFLEGAGRTIAAAALAALSARLIFCRRTGTQGMAAGPCPPCPWSDLCPARASAPPHAPKGETPHA